MALAISGCSAYSDIERINDNEFYVAGYTGAFGVTKATIERCKDEAGVIKCKPTSKSSKKKAKTGF